MKGNGEKGKREMEKKWAKDKQKFNVRGADDGE